MFARGVIDPRPWAFSAIFVCQVEACVSGWVRPSCDDMQMALISTNMERVTCLELVWRSSLHWPCSSAIIKLLLLCCSVNGKEKQFLRDLVGAVEETSGGRLARWLQPESVVDPTKCHLLLPGIFSTRVSSSTFNHFGSNGTSGASTGTSAKSVNSEGNPRRCPRADLCVPGGK